MDFLSTEKKEKNLHGNLSEFLHGEAYGGSSKVGEKPLHTASQREREREREGVRERERINVSINFNVDLKTLFLLLTPMGKFMGSMFVVCHQS